MITGMLGILKAGAAYVPLDPSYPAERLRFMMDDAAAPLVVTESAVLEKLLFMNEGDYAVVSLDGGHAVIDRYPADNLPPVNGRNIWLTSSIPPAQRAVPRAL